MAPVDVAAGFGAVGSRRVVRASFLLLVEQLRPPFSHAC